MSSRQFGKAMFWLSAALVGLVLALGAHNRKADQPTPAPTPLTTGTANLPAPPAAQ